MVIADVLRLKNYELYFTNNAKEGLACPKEAVDKIGGSINIQR